MNQAHHPAHHALIGSGYRYFGVENQKAIVDNVFACIDYTRRYAERNG